MIEQRQSVRWDIAVTTCIIALGVVIVAALTFSAFFLILAADPCGAEQCNVTQLTAGWVTALVVPGAILIAAIVVAIVRMVRGRLSFWIPVVGLALAVGGWFLGIALLFGAVPGFHP